MDTDDKNLLLLQASDRKERRERWTAFFDAEKVFFNWLNDHAFIMLDTKASSPMHDVTGNEANFGYEQYLSSSGKVMTRPPRFIRKVISFKNDRLFEECQDRIKKIESLFIDAVTFMNDKKVSIPQRFPLFYSNVIQINHTTDSAFSAKLLPEDGRFTVYSGVYNAELQNDIIQSFKSVGFPSLSIETDKYHFSMKASVDIRDLRIYFNCSDTTQIHCRKPSGTQYTCRISFNDPSKKAVRSKLGLIVLPSDSHSCAFFKSTPRKRRSDTLDQIGAEVFLPMYLGYRLFLTESE